jgi:putative phosphoribosyl transferase
MSSRQRIAYAEGIGIRAGPAILEANLGIPIGARGIVLFAHGSGSSRFSPRNRTVAASLNDSGIATLLIDLLTAEEEAIDRVTAHLRFDIELLTNRLIGATDWLVHAPETRSLRIGYFGASTGAAAALIASVQRSQTVGAIVARGGRPDLAGAALPSVLAPTLLIVGGRDAPVIDMNRVALAALRCEKRLEIVPGATHLFEEPGTLEQVANLARVWFKRYLEQERAPAAGFSPAPTKTGFRTGVSAA